MVTTPFSLGHQTEATTESYGATEASTTGYASEHKFHAADWAVFSLLLVGSVGIGVVSAARSRRKTTTQEFLLGGKNMPPVAVAISLLGGIISAISILGNPTEIYLHGTQITISLLGAIPATVIINKILIPVFYNLNLVSLNEYIELRYKSVVLRKLATLVTLLTFSVYVGLCLYAPSLALSTVTSLSTLNSMIIMGAIVTFYITIGGVKAVVYTDVLQTLLMFGGVFAVVVMCCIDLGGVREVWTIAERGGRLEFFNMDPSPYVRHTFWSTFTLGFFLIINGIGLNQTTFQRFASVRTLEISKRLSWFFLFGLWCLWCLFFFSGLVAYAVYNTCDPYTSEKISKPDQIIPFLVTDKLGHIPGMAGLFVASVYGGVLSTLSSTGNSAACLIWEDFLKPFPYFSNLSESSATRVIKILSSFTGVMAVGLGMVMGKLGNIFHVVLSITSAIAGPLSGVFLAGILFPWVEKKGALIGFLVSFFYNMWMVIGKFIRGSGHLEKLPLSMATCEGSFNTTLEDLVHTTMGSSSLYSTTVPTTLGMEEEANAKGIYDTSYCYNGLIGVSFTMLGAGIVSLLIGPNHPKDVEGGVLNPTCERLYKNIWFWYHKRRFFRNREINETQDHSLEMRMMPQHESKLLSPQ
ncbi:sodium-coupled monocarboxylate transporter 1-like isoform X2 [Portunus trituberculatus]|uniref:sodium-coupled monocarboxylate transporter 1-like isoform X2 n=1 Tax=Portunus trituberculatus TaxID=210409 RepID=UPI001E1D0E32|nr:sodium-coupled monocarboxylate transporter 1-like isoform X2 [Portunus trituberculatus]